MVSTYFHCIQLKISIAVCCVYIFRFLHYKERDPYPQTAAVTITNMSTTCGKCDVVFTKGQADSLIKCSGFCGKSFHATAECSDLIKSNQSFDRNALLALKNHENIMFMFAGCRTCLKSVSFIQLATKVESVLSSLEDVKLELMNQVNGALKSMKEGLKEDISNISSKVAQQPVEVKQSYASVVAPSYSPSNSESGIIGSGGEDDVIHSVPVKSKKFVFVSRLNNSTTKEKLLSFIGKKLTTTTEDDIICWPLVKLGVNTNTLSFISFKIGVPERNYQDLLNASFWPDGVLVREFIQKNIDHSKNSKNQPVSLE